MVNKGIYVQFESNKELDTWVGKIVNEKIKQILDKIEKELYNFCNADNVIVNNEEVEMWTPKDIVIVDIFKNMIEKSKQEAKDGN